VTKPTMALVALLIFTLTAATGWYFTRTPNFDPSQFGTLTFGVDAPYPPYEYFDDAGQLTGFEIDLGNQLCANLKLDCVWQVTPWDSIIADLNGGKFDVIMSSMSIEEERKKEVSFGEPYYSTPSVFFARLSDNIAGLSNRNLAGKAVAVQSGTLQEIYLQENYDSTLQILSLPGWDEVNKAFRSGEADLVFTDYPQWEGEFMLERVYEIIGETIRLGDGVALAFRKDDVQLRKGMNEGLAFMKENGQYEKIRREYFLYDILVK
jgi:arginine/ornithine transport system substrate-binding protein